MISVGYKNYVAINQIVAILVPGSRPLKNLIDGAKAREQLVDATHGKKTKSIIITDSNHIILSTNTPDTITQRINSLKSEYKRDERAEV